MQFKHPAFASIGILLAMLSGVSATRGVKEGDVFTATRVVHTLMRESPFIIDRTATMVWTAGPVIPDTESHTPIPHTIGTAPRGRSTST